MQKMLWKEKSKVFRRINHNICHLSTLLLDIVQMMTRLADSKIYILE